MVYFIRDYLIKRGVEEGKKWKCIGEEELGVKCVECVYVYIGF